MAGAPRADRGRERSRLTNVDVFALANAALFALMCAFVYYGRFVRYRGAGNVHEFFLYALALFAAIAWLWRHFRTRVFPTYLLLLLEAGILMHFAGGLATFGGGRLYDQVFGGIRYDKFVHFVNAGCVAVLVGRLYRTRCPRLDGLGRLFVLFAVLGLGAAVEIVEYLVCLSVPECGAGGYDNNLQDLLANLAGGALAASLIGRRGAPAGPPGRT